MNIVLVLLAAAALVFVVFRIVNSRRKEREKPVVYVCDQCGETDCDCHQKK